MKERLILTRTIFLSLVAGALFFCGIFLFSDSQKEHEIAVPPVKTIAWTNNGVHAIQNMEARLRMAPENVGVRVRLTSAYLKEAQQSLQGAHYLPKAQREIDKILTQDDENFDALALQASLYNLLHQFEKARDIAEGLITRSPQTAYVYGILVDALVELGEYEEAVRRCDEMLQLRPGLSSYSRAAYLRELHGDTEGAIEAMTLAAEAGVIGEIDRSWALYQLGQLYLGMNNLEAADAIFEGILDETPYYAYAIGGKAQVLMQQEKFEEAIDLFEEAYALVPADAFLEGSIEALQMLGHEKLVADYEKQLQQSYLDAAAMGENVRMEYADFMADMGWELDKALEMASQEYQRRPNHLHALETYAWTLHKNGRSKEAIPVIEKAMRLDTGDAMVFFRAGTIYMAAGQQEQAKQYFRAAMDANLQIESPSSAWGLLAKI